MKYFFWSSVVVWGSLAVYVVCLWARSSSLREKLASRGRGGRG